MKSESSALSRRSLFVAVGLASALAGGGVAWWRMRANAVDQAALDAFWAQRFERPEGGELAVSEWRGRPLLLNFWATWCPPCVEELPMIDAFWRENSSNGFQVLALAIDQPSSVKRFLGQQRLAFPVGLAGLQGPVLAASLGNPSGGLPFSVFFDANGGIWRQKLGRLVPKDLQEWRTAQGR